MDKRTPEQRLESLAQRLGCALDDPALCLAALTHKSYVNEHRDAAGGHNERLEFLGDAVVELAISHRLMERFPHSSEGELSRLRALLVNEEGLARVARQVGLGELLLVGRGEERSGGRDKSSLLADALEAVLGAIYLGSGLAKVMALVDRLFSEALQNVATGQGGEDYKTRLQETAQAKLKMSPRYRLIAQTGPDHQRVFEVEVVIGEEAHGRATGRSKKEAEQAAAQKTLAMLLAAAEKK